MLTKNYKALVAAVLASATLASAASAAVITSLIVPGTNNLHDSDRTALQDNVGAVPGEIDVGDVLYGAINFTELNSSGANIGGSTTNDQLTAVFAVQVTSKSLSVDGFGNANYVFGYGSTPAANFTSLLGISAPTGTTIVAFENATHDYTDSNGNPTPAGLAATLASAESASAFWTLGFHGATISPGVIAPDAATGEIWNTLITGVINPITHTPIIPASDNINTLSFVGTSSAFGSTLLAVNLMGAPGDIGPQNLAQFPAIPGVQVGQVTGQVGIEGTAGINGGSPFGATSDGDFQFQLVPEPTSLALLSLGAASLLRRQRKA